MFRKPAITLFFLLAAAGAALADQLIEREIPCPVCGNIFYAKLDVADSEGDMRLDLKPVGELSGPWRLPDCPKCGFVSYKLPIPGGELAKCRKISASADYKKHLARSTYFRVGLVYAGLRKSDYLVATSFLKASWQEESVPGRLKEDLETSLKWFAACELSCGPMEKENSLLLKGELLRRLGRFEEARAHLVKLQALKGFQKNFFGDIVEYQLTLCHKKDSAPHEMEDVRYFKKTFFGKMGFMLKKSINYIGELGGRVSFFIKHLW